MPGVGRGTRALLKLRLGVVCIVYGLEQCQPMPMGGSEPRALLGLGLPHLLVHLLVRSVHSQPSQQRA